MRRLCRRLRRVPLALAAILVGAAGCSGLPVKTEIVELPPLAAAPPAGAGERVDARVFVRPLEDAQPSPLDGMIDSLGAPLYQVSFSPPMTERLREVIERELTAAGCTLVDEASADIVVDGVVGTHRVRNETTPIYWDVHVEIAVRLHARGRVSGRACAPLDFRAQGTERTYLYPSHDVVRAASSKAFAGFASSLRAPRGLVDCIKGIR